MKIIVKRGPEPKLEKVGALNASKKSQSDWERLDLGLNINRKWLEDGLVVISSHPNFYSYTEKEKLQVNQTTVLHRKVAAHNSEASSIASNESVLATDLSFEQAFSFFSILVKFVNNNNSDESFRLARNIYFKNEKNQDVFIPMLFEDIQKKSIQFYLSSPISLDFSNHFSEKFDGVRLFVTAGCLFGAALQAVDVKESKFPMIRHKINFIEGDKIVRLSPCDDEFHPYEIAQFSFLEDILPLMKKLSYKNSQVKLIYHLPNFDYILSGIKLFIHDKISYEALLDFYSLVKKRSRAHVEQLNAIFKDNTITLSIQSPFMNLIKDFFANDDLEDDYEIIWEKDLDEFEKCEIVKNKIYITVKDARVVYKALNSLGLPEECLTDIECIEQEISQENIEKIIEQLLRFIEKKNNEREMAFFLDALGISNSQLTKKKLETAVVNVILTRLTQNRFSEAHKAAWNDFMKINSGKERINSLEMLFKTANAMMIAIAAKGQKDYAVCSFLPLNEKPIAAKYMVCSEKFAKTNISYPKVLPLIALERLICYSDFAKGNAFYFHPSPGQLAKRLHDGALTNPNQHFSFFAPAQTPTSVIAGKNENAQRFQCPNTG